MANLIKTDRLLPSEEVRFELAQYNNARDYHKLGFDNALENIRFYYGKNPELGLGQYKADAVRTLKTAGRQLIQQNFTLPIIDTIAGSLMQLKFNADFVPVNSKRTSLSEIPGKMIFSDREQMNWDHAAFDCALKGLIHDSAMKMVISDKFDPKGNIGLVSALMGSVYPDPQWKTMISSECQHVWHDAWMTAEQILEQYGKYESEIMAVAIRNKREGIKYGTNNGVAAYLDQTSATWGSLYRVMEHFYIEKKKRTARYLITDDGDVEVPKDIKDDSDAVQWLLANFPDFDAENVYEKPTTDRISKVLSFCPTLYGEDFFEDGETEVQAGCTPWKFWSASRLEGEPRGLLESLKDSNTYVNYWAGLTTHKIQVEGGGGAQFVDETMFKNDGEFKRWRKFRNNPLESFILKPGVLDKGGTPNKAVIASTYPAEVYKNIEFFVDKMLPYISKVTPTMRGMNEGGADPSGYLFRQKKIQSELQTYTIHYGWRLFWNDIYESYLLQAGQQYSNAGAERSFAIAGTGGREHIKVNEVVDLGEGQYGIKNDVSKLKNIRHAVIISEKPDSPTDQAERLMLYSETVKSFAPFPQKATSVGILMNLMVENMGVKEEDKAILTKVGKLETELAVLTLEGQVAQAKAGVLAAENALKAQEAQAAAQAAAEASGQLPPGAVPGAGGAPGAAMPPEMMTSGAEPVKQAAPAVPPLLNAPQSAGGPNV